MKILLIGGTGAQGSLTPGLAPRETCGLRF
jgi:hypothetical protein